MAQIPRLEQSPRVLTIYNASGAVLFYGGPTTKVSIDGRTDLYGGDYIERHVAALNLAGDFQGLLAQLDPNLALLRDASGLAWYLEHHEMWSRVLEEGEYVLLAKDE